MTTVSLNLVWVVLGALLVLAWRWLPPGQALLATLICAAAVWLQLHPTAAAQFLTVIRRFSS